MNIKSLFCLLLLVQEVAAQNRQADLKQWTTLNSDSVMVIADTSFRKRGLRSGLLGDHYRREWLTPVKVAAISIDTLLGGLQVVKAGGGFQTKSLRLVQTSTGKEFVLRSIEKFPEKALPEAFAGTFASDFVKDQISSAHPYAPLAVAYLADAAGLYHTNPKICFVQPSESLGEYSRDFSNRLVLFEERPRGNWSNASNFGYSDKVVDTDELFKQLEKSSRNRVDEAMYIRARLFDIWIGDWDRHEEQWTWASRKEGSLTIYRPIGKDRDQAFAKLDGVLPWIGRRKWAVRHVQHFGETITDLPGLIWSARQLDRRIMTDLSWADWKSQAEELQRKLNNDVIGRALAQLPVEIQGKNVDEIYQKLTARRDALVNYAALYYQFIQQEVSWVGTNDDDRFEFSQVSDSSFLLRQFTDGNVLVRERVFLKSNTRELRIFGLQGNDEFSVDAINRLPISVRLIGGEGQNNYKTIEPDKRLAKLLVYDTINTTEVRRGFHMVRRWDSLTHTYRYKQKEYDWLLPIFLPAFNPDDGVFIGLAALYKRQSWGKSPFSGQHYFGGEYAFKTGAYRIWYNAHFTRAAGKWDALVHLAYNGPTFVRNFYGLGNETVRSQKDNAYYRVRMEQVNISVGLSREVAPGQTLKTFLTYQNIQVQNNLKRYVSTDNPAIKPIDFERSSWWGGAVQYSINRNRHNRFPRKGWYVQADMDYLRSLGQGRSVYKPQAQAALFLPLGPLVWATRIGAATVHGEPAFFHYPQLDGLSTLRGYRRSRFAGKTAVYQNNELRVPITVLKGYILRGRLGITLFEDHGRVWMPGESSDRWHVGYGAGAWILPYNRLTFTVQYGWSHEGGMVLARTGFLF